MLKHFYVTLLDLPEAMPFTFTTSEDISNLESDEKIERTAEKRLITFVSVLTKKYGEKFAYIGDDIIGEKFYKRFLFEKNGFLEIMTGVPAVISAHFTTEKKAKRFALALKATIQQQVKNEKARGVLVAGIEVSEDEASRLSFEKWEKLREIRLNTNEK